MSEEAGGEAVVYLRCSDKKQAEKELSIPAQQRQCESFAAREGFLIKHAPFVDAGKTGTKDNRAGFQQAIRYALDNCDRVKAFICYDTSRFARNRLDAIKYKLQLRDAGIKVMYVTQQIGEDPDGEFLEGILELMDFRYSRVLGRTALRGMKEKALKGCRPGGRAPIGYRFINKGEVTGFPGNLTYEESEKGAVELMFRMALSGAGDKAIAEALDAGGFRTRDGRAVRKTSISYWLKSETYTGALVFNRRASGLGGRGKKDEEEVIRIPGVFPAYITVEDFDEIQRMRVKRSPKVTNPGVTATPHVLTGLLVCEKCGAAMTVERSYGRNQTAYLYYSCNSRKMKAKRTCEGVRLRVDKLEPQVLKFIYDELFSRERIEHLVRSLEKLKGRLIHEKESDRVRLQAELKRIDEKIGRLVDALVEGNIPKAEYERRVAQLKEREAELNAELAKIPQAVDVRHFKIPERTIQYFQEGLKELCQTKDPMQVKAFLSRYIEEIRVNETEAWITGSLAKEMKGGGGGDAESGASHCGAWLPLLDALRTSLLSLRRTVDISL